MTAEADGAVGARRKWRKLGAKWQSSFPLDTSNVSLGVMARRARRTMGNRLQSLSVSRLHGQSCAIFSDIRSWHSKGKLYEASEACFDYVSEKDLCKMIGNSVPVPLIGEIMQEAMFAAGLISEKKQFLASRFQLDWLHRPAWLLRPKSISSSRLTWGRVKKRCFKDPIFWLPLFSWLDCL